MNIEELFLDSWEAEIAKRSEQSPSFTPDQYTATGRASAQYGGRRNIAWWADNGPQMVQDWVDWRAQTGWALLDINGKPAIEIEMNFLIPGLEMMVKAFIDRVFVLPTGEPAILDLKTGRTPETAEQLGLYRVGMGLTFGIWVDWGYYWHPGGKPPVGPLPLTKYTPDYFARLYEQAIAGVNAGAFLPQPANNCKAWCGVSRWCAAVGGERAHEVDPLAV